MESEKIKKVLAFLDERGFVYDWYEHPEAPTIAIAKAHWRQDGSKHCKNLFFRNHKYHGRFAAEYSDVRLP